MLTIIGTHSCASSCDVTPYISSGLAPDIPPMSVIIGYSIPPPMIPSPSTAVAWEYGYGTPVYREWKAMLCWAYRAVCSQSA